MANPPELNLEELASQYEAFLSREVIRLGEQRPTERFYDRVFCMEVLIADKCGLYDHSKPSEGLELKRFIPYRREILLEKLFQRASRLSLDTDLLSKVSMTVSEPILDVLLPYAVNGVIREGARSDLNESVPEMLSHHFNLLRPILLLDILDKYPQTAQRLQEDSAYDPARLFPPHPKRLSPKKAFEKELARTIVSLYPSEVVELLDKIKEYVCEAPQPRIRNRIGAFNPSEFLKLYFTAQALAEPEKARQELEEIYCAAEPKKAIVNTLAQLRTVLLCNYHLREQLKTKKISFLRLSGTQQTLLQDFLRNYATNQILAVWQKKGEVYCPPIAKSLRLRGVPIGKNLRIEDEILRCSSEFPPDFKYRPTSYFMPFVAYLMDKIYKSAKGLAGEESQG